MTQQDLMLAARLYERRKGAVSVKRVSIEGSGWQPDPNQCHRNVTLWCSSHPKHIPVRGWLVADYSDIGFYRFFAHSVVETETGGLVDITPNLATWNYPFLRHDAADGDFAEIVEDHEVISITHRPG
jgi:hypothetical protein